MENIKLQVFGNQIEVMERPAVLTAGTVGMEAEFTFDSQWDTLSKTLVFKAGEKVVAAALVGNTHSIPWEVLEKPNQWLCVGVYGANREGTVVIPTLWAKISVIHTGVDPEGDSALEPTAPIWQEALYLAECSAAALDAVAESLGPELLPGHISPMLSDLLNEMVGLDRQMEYMLNEHTDNQENPHHVTCEQIGAATNEDILGLNVVTQNLSDEIGNANVSINIHMQDEGNPHGVTAEQIGAVTKEQHDADITRAISDAVSAAYDQSIDWAGQEIGIQVEGIYNSVYKKAEVDAAVAESKAVIVTVNGTTPSRTSQEIYALIQEGKVVYLQLWGNTYTICSACTASEAKFENSYITSVTGADGKSYQAQQFRVYLIKNNVFNNGQAVTVPGTAYIDAQIAYVLGQ